MEDYVLINYIKKQLSKSEIEQVESWLNASFENREYFNKVKELWHQAGEIPELSSPDIEAAWERFDNSITKRKLWNTNQMIFKAAAAIAILIGLYFIFHSQMHLFKPEKFIALSSGDSIMKFTLADGSVAWLNKHSKIEYSNKYGLETRNIKLFGEAFFEVKHIDNIPFEIKTQQASIKDIGTSFNVKSDTVARKIKVAVVSGIVALTDIIEPVNEAELHQNQVGIWFANHSIKIKNVNNINENAWLTKKLVFHNQLFSEIAETIGLIYNSKISIDDKNTRDIRITASFDHQSLTDIINVLGQTTNLNYKITNNEVVFYK